MHENPSEFLNGEKRRKQMLKKAIQYMEKRGEDTEEMNPEEIVEAAEKFEEFVKKEK